MTYEQLEYVQRWFPGHEWSVARAIFCESGWEDTATVRAAVGRGTDDQPAQQ